MTRERGRRRERGRPRPVEESLPTPERFDEDVRILVMHLLAARQKYRRTYVQGLTAPTGAGMGLSGTGPSKPTEAAWQNGELDRDRCRRAAGWIDDALGSVKKAEDTLIGDLTEQPPIHGKATMTPRQYDELLHRKRERDLRGDG